MIKSLSISTALIAMSLLTSCSKSDSAAPAGQAGQGGAPTCSLAGTWARCDTDGVQSQKILITFAADNTMAETISSYNSNTTCAGADDGNFNINGSFVLGTQGASAAVSGGTDVDLNSVQDIGCGAGGTSYTVIKIADDCGQFQNSNVQPGCDANNRGSTLDSNPFVKQ